MLRLGASIFLAILLLLTGCANPAKKRRVHNPIPGEEVAREYLLLNENGEVGPSVDPLTGRRPFMAVLYLPEYGERTQCSGFNLNGYGPSAGHCIPVESDEPVKLTDIYFIYYSKIDGRRRIGHPKSIVFHGSSKYDDAIIFEFTPEMKLELDMLTPKLDGFVREYSDTDLSETKPTMEFTNIQFLDPLPPNSPLLKRYGARWGGKYVQESLCPASRRVWWVKKKKEVVRYEPENKILDPRLHIFIDRCNIAGGNSGGYISTSGGQAIGVVNWYLKRSNFGPDQQYFGSERRWTRIWPEGASPEKDGSRKSQRI